MQLFHVNNRLDNFEYYKIKICYHFFSLNFIALILNTIEETRKLLREFEYKYNCEKMHQSLNYLTPMEYYYKLKEKCA